MGLPTGDEATEARRWGIDVEKLREHLKGKTAVSSTSRHTGSFFELISILLMQPSMMTAFDNAFDEAIREILQYSKVFMGEDTE